jgi:hypothetical protein
MSNSCCCRVLICLQCREQLHLWSVQPSDDLHSALRHLPVALQAQGAQRQVHLQPHEVRRVCCWGSGFVSLLMQHLPVALKAQGA